MLLQQFRQTVHQSLIKRADAFLDLLDALTIAGHVNSPVALSEETPFRRKFNTVFDTLRQAEFDFDELLPVLHDFQPPDSEKIAGYEVYGLDTTKRPGITTAKRTDAHQWTPGQIQRGAARFIARLGTPARATRRAGKGKGRSKGYRPTPKTRFPVVKKAKTASNRASQSP